MILKPGNPWGFITGKLSLNPAQALAMFGFTMRPDAHGVIFRGYTYLDDNNRNRRGNFISNYIPPSNPQTPRQQANRGKLRNAVTGWHGMHPPGHDYWNALAVKRHLRMSGFNLYVSRRLRGLI